MVSTSQRQLLIIFQNLTFQYTIHAPLQTVLILNNYFNLHVCLSICRLRLAICRLLSGGCRLPSTVYRLSVTLSNFQFLQSYHKMSLIKVACYVLREKNMHSGPSFDAWDPWGEVKLSYVNYDIMRGAAKPCIPKLNPVFHHLTSVDPKQLCVSTPRMYPRRVGTS